MKYSFYCFPLRKKVKAKVTAVVKKKSYGIKGEYRYKGKTHNCYKVCSKAEAERVAKESGLDIQFPEMEEKASETHTMPDGTEMPGATHAEETPEGVEEVAMLGDDTFHPDGNGRVIGSNSASMVTATPGTDAVVTVNATPFHSENEDKIGPMSMAGEELKRDSCCCGATKEKPCACMIQGVMYCTGDGDADPCPCAQERLKKGLKGIFEDISHLGADGAVIETEAVNPEGLGSDVTFDDSEWETFELSKPLFSALTAHADWADMVSDGVIKVFRDNDLVHVSAPGPFADDLLDMIIECHEFPMLDDDTYVDDRFLFESESKKLRKNALLFSGFGALGLISAILLYRRFSKYD
ncbi:MAG TPA: hypothetical protein EYF95_08625 [Flavobacteriales bacterium]|nr:hypothetical protein [Flavobacteriales bacterium]